ncbi:hypothetical protein [Flavisolibacter nicotianae]|uniref:hypothetical protein n=1 Tax=Flavisolibacter nicotianae TaxID=2364882 RepID=UPI000EB325E5|nr:hypothetical protein [Flavisolibacter nicotianae]
MFNNISWQGYWITIALLTAGYYLVIYLLYFRKDFSIEWRKDSKRNEESPFLSTSPDSAVSFSDAVQQSSLFDNFEEFQRPSADTIEHAVYTCMDEINAYLEEAKRSKCIKEEMLYALYSILKKFPAISTSEYKESVTNVIVNQCEYLCSVHLNADDVVRVWVGW